MRCNTVRRRVDPVLTPDQFSVARPLWPEDLGRRVTRYGFCWMIMCAALIGSLLT